jgi:hypothetical protein
MFLSNVQIRAPHGAVGVSAGFDVPTAVNLIPDPPNPDIIDYVPDLPAEYSYTLNGQRVRFVIHGFPPMPSHWSNAIPLKVDVTVNEWGSQAGDHLFWVCQQSTTAPG